MTLDYVYKFFDTYKGKRKFMQFITESAHSYFDKNGEYIDEHLSAFLWKMDKAGHLDNTIVQIYSDHGDHVHVFFEYSPSGIVEKLHTELFTIVPAKVADRYHENMIKNEQRLITHFEIFETARRYTKTPLPDTEKLNLMPIHKAYSVMEEEVPAGRSCSDLPLIWQERDCRCYHDHVNFK
jgi:arylsulfatase A-like enzyme